MAKWQHRSVVYKVALLLLYFVFLVFALAFSIPTWFSVGKVQGLWAECEGSSQGGNLHNCVKKAFGDDEDWVDGVRGVWLAGMFIYVVAVMHSVLENFCVRDHYKDYGVTGTLAIFAGLCGAVGVIVAAIEIEENNNSYAYLWGYMLACITSGLTVILAIIILITRNVSSSEKSRDNRTADYVFAHKQANPYVSEYTNQGYNRDDIPLANGVTYQHTPAAHPYTMYQNGFHNNNIPQTRSQVDGQPGKSPYGYYNGKPQQWNDPTEANMAYRDLSNGYTNELINAEHTLSRPNIGQRADFVRGGGSYTQQDYSGRNDNYPNGSRLY